MDKKILLSILIVALIGIVAATYQINIGDDALNPLTSVISGDAPVTDALEAPSSGDSANTGVKVAQKQTSKDQANSQSNGTSQDNTNKSQSSSSSGSSLINSENPVTTSGNQGTNSNGNNKVNQASDNGDNNVNQANDNGNNKANQASTDNQGTSDTSKSENIRASDISVVQANTLIKTLHINDNLNISISSVTTVTDDDGNTWYIYQATYKDNPNEEIHVYYPKDRSKSSPYVYEEGSGQDVSGDNRSYGDEGYLNMSR